MSWEFIAQDLPAWVARPFHQDLEYLNRGAENRRRRIHQARIAAILMTLTAVTGWVYYYLAFVAT